MKLLEVQEWKDGKSAAEFGSVDIKKEEILSMRVEIKKPVAPKKKEPEPERAQNFSCIDDPVEEEEKKSEPQAEFGPTEFKPTR